MVLLNGLGFTATYENHPGLASNQYATEQTARELARLTGGTAVLAGGYDEGPYSAPAKWYVVIDGVYLNAGLMAQRFESHPLSYALLQTADQVKRENAVMTIPSGGEAEQAIQQDIAKYGGATNVDEFLGEGGTVGGAENDNGIVGDSGSSDSVSSVSDSVSDLVDSLPSWLIPVGLGLGALVWIKR